VDANRNQSVATDKTAKYLVAHPSPQARFGAHQDTGNGGIPQAFTQETLQGVVALALAGLEHGTVKETRVLPLALGHLGDP